MKKGEMIALRNVINQMRNMPEYGSYPVKFRYAINRTMERSESELKSLQEMEKEIREKHLKKYDEEAAPANESLRDARTELIKGLGIEDGRGGYFIPQDDTNAMNEYRAKLLPLEEKHAEELLPINKKYKKELEDYDNSMIEYQKEIIQGSESELQVYSVSSQHLPDTLPEYFLQALSSPIFGLIVD